MKTTTRHGSAAVVLSLTLNAVLLAVLVWTSSGPFRRLASSRASGQLTNRAIRVVRPATWPVRAATSHTVEVIEPFHWSQIESQDYRVYVANLRAMGCPEATVRDIIMADVNELFHRRVKEIVDPLQNRFWELLSDREKFKSLLDEKEVQLRGLDGERDEVLDALLGGEARRKAAEDDTRQQQRQTRRRALDFLPPDKLEACLAIEEKFNQSMQQIYSVQPPRPQAEIGAAFERLRQQQDLELQQTLAADDWVEYKLRRSRFANLRERLGGFDATEDEMRSIVRIREEVGAAAGSGSPSAPPSDPETQKAQQQALEEVLGKDRLAQFERAADPRFQEIYAVTDRLDLAPEVAADAFAMRRAVDDQAQQIRNNQDLTPVEREDLLMAIRQETESSLAQTLGTQAFGLYRSRFGYWLDQLTTTSGR